jgi:hypothetical protein
VDANNVFFVRPTGHQALDIAVLHGLIKSHLYIVGTPAQGGGSQFIFGHAAIVPGRYNP